MKLLLEKNPQVRIVINCITLETVSEALETAKEFGFEENEIVQLSAARSKAIGRYHMMMGDRKSTRLKHWKQRKSLDLKKMK